MKNLFRLSFLCLLTVATFTACEDDPIGGGSTGGGNADGSPEAVLVEEAGFVNSSATLAPGETFTVKLRAAKGENDLQGVLFDIDGSAFGFDEATSRITINGDAAVSDAVTVLSTETAAFTWEIAIISHTDISTKTYTFNVRDVEGLVSSQSVIITTTGTGGGDVVPPTIMSSMGTVAVAPNSLFSLPINITAGNPALFQMGVLEVINGDSVWVEPLSRLQLDGVQFVSNPFELDAADTAGFDKNLTIRSQADASLTKYIILFSDEQGNIYSSDFALDTRPQGSDVTTLRGVLFNRAGPMGTGGLDMDSGGSTGSADVNAELKDNGIDSSVPDANNWLQSIAGANGTEVKYLRAGENGLAGDFSFGAVTKDIEIESVWGNGIDFSLINSNGELSSNPINVGDTFVALRDGKYYLFVIREVNVTATDNTDNYVMDISF